MKYALNNCLKMASVNVKYCLYIFSMSSNSVDDNTGPAESTVRNQWSNHSIYPELILRRTDTLQCCCAEALNSHIVKNTLTSYIKLCYIIIL